MKLKLGRPVLVTQMKPDMIARPARVRTHLVHERNHLILISKLRKQGITSGIRIWHITTTRILISAWVANNLIVTFRIMVVSNSNRCHFTMVFHNCPLCLSAEVLGPQRARIMATCQWVCLRWVIKILVVCMAWCPILGCRRCPWICLEEVSMVRRVVFLQFLLLEEISVPCRLSR